MFCIFSTSAAAQLDAERAPSDPAAAASSDEAVTKTLVVWCLLQDFGSQKIFYSPAHTVRAPVGASKLRQLSARFVRSVNAQQNAALDVSQGACSGSPTTQAASGAMTRRMAPLLGRGYVAVAVGVY